MQTRQVDQIEFEGCEDSAKHLKADFCDATAHQPQFTRSAMSQINHSVPCEWASVIDANNGSATVPEIGHTNLCPEGQSAVSGCHRARSEHLTVGGSIAVKAWPVPTRFTRMRGDDNRSSRLGRLRRCRWRKRRRLGDGCDRSIRCNPAVFAAFNGSNRLHGQHQIKGICDLKTIEISGKNRVESQTCQREPGYRCNGR